jgi:hypothetical protein
MSDWVALNKIVTEKSMTAPKRLIKTGIHKMTEAGTCDDCDGLIPIGAMAVTMTKQAQRGVLPSHFLLHRRCAVDLGGDLAGEIARI